MGSGQPAQHREYEGVLTTRQTAIGADSGDGEGNRHPGAQTTRGGTGQGVGIDWGRTP
jgi:uncharacterized spore protein YtfJ